MQENISPYCPSLTCSTFYSNLSFCSGILLVFEANKPVTQNVIKAKELCSLPHPICILCLLTYTMKSCLDILSLTALLNYLLLELLIQCEKSWGEFKNTLILIYFNHLFPTKAYSCLDCSQAERLWVSIATVLKHLYNLAFQQFLASCFTL